MEKESLTYDEWAKKYGGPHSVMFPVILPSAFPKIFKDKLLGWQVEDLKNDKIVLIEGFWCILSKNLKTTS